MNRKVVQLARGVKWTLKRFWDARPIVNRLMVVFELLGILMWFFWTGYEMRDRLRF
jgi:hypothetical protein